jgi:hypothetical protein
LKWSNGQVEGQVNRLKNIKRQMYGRGGFELLKKGLEENGLKQFTKSDEEPVKILEGAVAVEYASKISFLSIAFKRSFVAFLNSVCSLRFPRD